MPRNRVDPDSYAKAFSFSLTDEDRSYWEALVQKVKKDKSLDEDANKTDVMRFLLRQFSKDWGLTNKDGSIKSAYVVKAKKASAKPKKTKTRGKKSK